MRTRKPRTKYTHEQLRRLLDVFSQRQYLDLTERSKLAVELGLTQTQVSPGLFCIW
uniref:Homeobox domain-containing protein n=1 Tax=Mesocestoides corti TaxID=53468 RepID=A0A5K3FVY8_MESCO